MAKKGEWKQYIKGAGLAELYEKKQAMDAKQKEHREKARDYALIGFMLDREIKRREGR